MTKGKLNHENMDCGYNATNDPVTPCAYNVVVRATDPAGDAPDCP